MAGNTAGPARRSGITAGKRASGGLCKHAGTGIHRGEYSEYTAPGSNANDRHIQAAAGHVKPSWRDGGAIIGKR